MNIRPTPRFTLILFLGFLLHFPTPARTSPQAAPAGAASLPAAHPNLSLAEYASGLDKPTDIANTGVPGDERLFITEKDGLIRILLPGGAVLPTPFLEIDGKVQSGESERGLLGLVFDPDYAANGFFYIHYTYASTDPDLQGDSHISRFTVSSGDPNTADPGSELVLLTINQPTFNHNGGDLAFGPDGYLYIGLGDGEGGGDLFNNAQNLGLLLGKMIRIDLDPGEGSAADCFGAGSGQYSIPPTNPFTDGPGGACDEIWSLGFRNPWRFSFDPATGDLYISDVGEDAWEEINVQPASSMGGENYGWHCYEGNHEFLNFAVDCAGATLTFPVHEYPHPIGGSITGGFVYRGSLYPDMAGHYIFADYGHPPTYTSARIWSMYYDGAAWHVKEQAYRNGNFSSFGADIYGELFLADVSNGLIYRLFTTPHVTHLPIIQLIER